MIVMLHKQRAGEGPSSVMLLEAMLLLPLTLCKTHIAKCTVSDPGPILHKYYQEGDAIIGSIGSHIYVPSEMMSFKDQPNFTSYSIPL